MSSELVIMLMTGANNFSLVLLAQEILSVREIVWASLFPKNMVFLII